MSYARIAGTGSCLPDRVLTNADLERMVDTSDQWIVERTGIRQRHIAGEGESTSDLAAGASRAALKAAGVDGNDVDLIIVATTTPDQIFPSTACLLQEKLDIANRCPAFDVQAVCGGFIYALAVAEKFIRTGSSRCALVVGAETFSRLIDWQDRGTCVLFGDGAGAVVLTAADEPGILSSHLHAQGQHHGALEVPARLDRGELRGKPFVVMEGQSVFKFAVRALDEIVEETLAANGLEKSAVDWLVPHQANLRIIGSTAKKLGLPMERVVVTLDRHGNTSAASIPLALDVAVRDGRIQPGQLVLMEGIGGGFAWGSVLVRWS